MWDDSNDKDKVSSTSNDCVEDTVNNVDVDDGHTGGHVGNVYHGKTDGHSDARTWSDVSRRGMIGVSNVRIFIA